MRRLGIWVLALAFGSAADVGAQDDVDRLVDDTHAAFAEHALDAIAPVDRRADQRIGRRLLRGRNNTKMVGPGGHRLLCPWPMMFGE